MVSLTTLQLDRSPENSLFQPEIILSELAKQHLASLAKLQWFIQPRLSVFYETNFQSHNMQLFLHDNSVCHVHTPKPGFLPLVLLVYIYTIPLKLCE